MAFPPEGAARPPRAPGPLGLFFAGVAISVGAVLSQYFVPRYVPSTLVLYGNLPGDVFVVYGIPLLAFAVLVGGGPLRDWSHRMGLATVEGLRWYGLLSLLALLVLIALVLVYLSLDPGALGLLNRPNPALQQARGNPWFFVGFSFVVGAIEETIFRGWIFGYWRDRPGSWVVAATWTSAVFALVHVYYAITYLAAAPLIFPTLFLTGFAFAATYRYSGGNLVVVSLLHGARDALAFLTVVSSGFALLGISLHYLLILIGSVIGLVVYLGRGRRYR